MTPEVQRKLSLRASITGEIVLDNVRLPRESAMLPKASGLKGPLSALSEARYGIVFGVTGAARDSLEEALRYTDTRIQFDPVVVPDLAAEASRRRSAVLRDHAHGRPHRPPQGLPLPGCVPSRSAWARW